MSIEKNKRCGNCANKAEEQRCGGCQRKQKSKSLKIQGDLKNGIYVVDNFYQESNHLEEDKIWVCELTFDFMENSAVEIIDPFLIDLVRISSDVIQHIDQVDFEEHINNCVLNDKIIECSM